MLIASALQTGNGPGLRNEGSPVTPHLWGVSTASQDHRQRPRSMLAMCPKDIMLCLQLAITCLERPLSRAVDQHRFQHFYYLYDKVLINHVYFISGQRPTLLSDRPDVRSQYTGFPV